MSKTYVEILGEYRILAVSTMRYDERAVVKHEPCQKLIFGCGGDPRELDVAELMVLIDEHECEAELANRKPTSVGNRRTDDTQDGSDG